MTYILILISISVVYIIKKFTRIFSIYTFYASVIFILLSLLVGKAFKFYEIIPKWDLILHFLSGFIIAPIGKRIYVLLGGDSKNKKFIIIFILCFAISTAAAWEIYEFTTDMILGTNSQNNSLSDTMWDIIAGSLSSAIYLLTFKFKYAILNTRR